MPTGPLTGICRSRRVALGNRLKSLQRNQNGRVTSVNLVIASREACIFVISRSHIIHRTDALTLKAGMDISNNSVRCCLLPLKARQRGDNEAGWRKTLREDFECWRSEELCIKHRLGAIRAPARTNKSSWKALCIESWFAKNDELIPSYSGQPTYARE